MPRAYSVQITPGNFGEMAVVNASGADITGVHSVAVSLQDEFEHPDLAGSFTYTYGRLPVDVSFQAYRSLAPRTDGLQIGQAYQPTWIQETLGASVGLGYAMPRAFDEQSFSLSYGFQRVGGQLNIPVSKYDPYATPSYPLRGVASDLHLGYGYSNAEGYLHSVGNERGFSFNAGLDVADPWLGGDFKGFTATAQLATYWPMPWHHHHVLALHASTGAAGGAYPGRGEFYVGGFIDEPVVSSIQSTIVQSNVVLRGYAPVTEVGQYFSLFNAEYRFPIWETERGLSTLPAFLSRISGDVFTDYGSAYDDPRTAQFKTGSGAELWFDLTFSYVVSMTFRLGFAHGWASAGIDHAYFVAVAAF